MIRQILTDQLRFLTFRPLGDGVANHWRQYLAYGFFVTWLVGMGRYWDNPRASWFQHAGFGSIAYILFLSLLLWLLFYPLKPRRWSFQNVLLFVSLCSLPAILYAIPVERFMALDSAQTANVWFLAVVATWRVGLLVWFLRKVAGLAHPAVVVATLLPIALIVVVLSWLNLEHVVFSLMAGVRPEDVTGNDAAYGIVWLISIFSVLALPVLLIAYAVLIYRARRTA